MTTELTNVTEKMDKIAKGIYDIQEIHKKTSDRLDIIEKEQVSKISNDVSGLVEAIQDLRQKQNAQEVYSKEIEKILSRMPNNAINGITEDDIRAKNEMLRYLRKCAPLSQEVVQSICADVAKKSFLGATPEELQFHTKSLVEGTDPTGGYFVRPQLLATMVKRIFETSPIRNIATTVTTVSDSVEMIIDDNQLLDGGWVGETSTRGDTGTPDVGKLNIPAHEVFAQPNATQKMLDDAGFDIEAWLMNKVTDRISRTENTAFVVGDGSNKPKGFLSYPAWATPSAFEFDGTYERGKLDQIHSGTPGDFSGDNVKILQNSLLEDYQANAVWVMQRKTFDRVITLKDGVGRYLLTPESLMLKDELTLLGKRVIFAADMPSIASNALVIAYGDFRLGYTIVDRVGFRVLRDPYTTKGYVKFYVTKRTGGAVSNYQCLKLLLLST